MYLVVIIRKHLLANHCKQILLTVISQAKYTPHAKAIPPSRRSHRLIKTTMIKIFIPLPFLDRHEIYLTLLIKYVNEKINQLF